MRCVLLLLMLGAMAVGAWADSSGRLAPARGMLLVAAEGMPDPRFARSVILLIDYGPRNVVGLIVNHPTRLTLQETLGESLDFGTSALPLFYGGPLSSGAVTSLLRTDTAPPESSRIVDGLFLLQVERIPPALRREAGVERLRVFSGYAGWKAGQLAGEIARGSWYVIPCDPALLFDTPPERLWDTLRRRGSEVWL